MLLQHLPIDIILTGIKMGKSLRDMSLMQAGWISMDRYSS